MMFSLAGDVLGVSLGGGRMAGGLGMSGGGAGTKDAARGEGDASTTAAGPAGDRDS